MMRQISVNARVLALILEHVEEWNLPKADGYQRILTTDCADWVSGGP
jgi:hypothetical protein